MNPRLLLLLALLGPGTASASEWSRAGGDAWGSGHARGRGAMSADVGSRPGQVFAIASPEVRSAAGTLADVDGGPLEYVVPSRGRIVAWSGDGDVVWASPTVGATHVVGVVDLLGSGRDQLLIADAGVGGGMHLLDLRTGALLWSTPDLPLASGVDPREVVLRDFDDDGVDELVFSGWTYGAADVHLVDLSTADAVPRATSVPLSGAYLGLTELVAADVLVDAGVEVVVPMSTDLDVIRACSAADPDAFCDPVDGTVCLCEVGLLTDVWAGRAFPTPSVRDVDGDGLEELLIVNDLATWDRGFGVLDVGAALAGGELARWYFDHTAEATVPLRSADLDGHLVVTLFDAGTGETALDGSPADDGLEHAGGFTVGLYDPADGTLRASLEDHYGLGVTDLDGDGIDELVTQSTVDDVFAGGSVYGWELLCDPDCAFEEAWTLPGSGGVRNPEQYDGTRFPPRVVRSRGDTVLLWTILGLSAVALDGSIDGSVTVRSNEVVAAFDEATDTLAIVEDFARARLHVALAEATPFPLESNRPARWLAADLGNGVVPLVDGRVYSTVEAPVDRDDADLWIGDGVLLVDDLDDDGAADPIVYFDNEAVGTVSVRRVSSDGAFVWTWTSAVTGFDVPNPYATTTADFDGDGVRDLVIDLRRGFDSLSVVLDGASGAVLHRAPIASRRAFHVPPLAVDLVGDEGPDGELDLVRVSERHVSIWELGEAAPVEELQTSDFLVRGAWTDLDDDGVPELIGAMSLQANRRELSAYRVWPALERVWGPVTDLPDPPDVEQALAIVGDDVAWISAEGSVDLRAAADGSRRPGFPVTVADSPLSALVTLDVDGDDEDELVVGARDGTLAAVSLDGDVEWSVFVDSEVVNLGAADVDDDGDLELLVSTGDGDARLFDGLGAAVEITSPDPEDCVKTSPLVVSGTSRGVDGVRLEVAGRSAEATVSDDGSWSGAVSFPLVGGLVEVVAVGTVSGADAAFDSRLLPSHEDGDGDGTTACGGDCDDEDPARSPELEELACDGIDNDCEETTGDGTCEEPVDEGCSCDCGSEVAGGPAAGATLAFLIVGWRRRW